MFNVSTQDVKALLSLLAEFSFKRALRGTIFASSDLYQAVTGNRAPWYASGKPNRLQPFSRVNIHADSLTCASHLFLS